MKVELICGKCGGKRFINRASGWQWRTKDSTKSKTYECKKCGANIELIYDW